MPIARANTWASAALLCRDSKNRPPGTVYLFAGYPLQRRWSAAIGETYAMSMIAAVIGRILIGALFIVSGLNKIVSPGTTAQYIESTTTLPGYLAMPTGVF